MLQQPIFTSISLVRWVSQRVSEQASERERERNTNVFSSDAGPHCHGMSRCEAGSSTLMVKFAIAGWRGTWRIDVLAHGIFLAAGGRIELPVSASSRDVGLSMLLLVPTQTIARSWW